VTGTIVTYFGVKDLVLDTRMEGNPFCIVRGKDGELILAKIRDGTSTSCFIRLEVLKSDSFKGNRSIIELNSWEFIQMTSSQCASDVYL
jgi:hypothetical protein